MVIRQAAQAVDLDQFPLVILVRPITLAHQVAPVLAVVGVLIKKVKGIEKAYRKCFYLSFYYMKKYYSKLACFPYILLESSSFMSIYFKITLSKTIRSNCSNKEPIG